MTDWWNIETQRYETRDEAEKRMKRLENIWDKMHAEERKNHDREKKELEDAVALGPIDKEELQKK